MNRTPTIFFALTLVIAHTLFAADWPQAAGPHGNFIVQGDAPTDFSGATGKNVKWRAPLPSTGQSAAIVSGGLIFVTSHEPINQDTATGRNILGMCFFRMGEGV